MGPHFPMRWPSEWRRPSALELVKGTPVDCLMVEQADDLKEVVAEARRAGLAVCTGSELPPGVVAAKGEWPGVRSGRNRGEGSAGPTGAPWVDSNGWLIRATALLNPGKRVWITTELPKENEILPAERFRLALADAAAHGGSWVVNLDGPYQRGLAEGKADTLQAWKKLTQAMQFFRTHQDWNGFEAKAVLAVVSDFAKDNEFLSHEFLNLTARLNQQYRLVDKTRLKADDLRGMKAAVYPDPQAPTPEVKQILNEFARAGGLVIAGPEWGPAEGAATPGDPHPRYDVRVAGKGRIAVAREAVQDPYILAGDAQILMSHRNDIVRFWNGGSLGSYLTGTADGSRTLLHVVNYSARASREQMTAWVAGRYRTARIWRLDDSAPDSLRPIPEKNGVELHLPPIPVYAGIELTA